MSLVPPTFGAAKMQKITAHFIDRNALRPYPVSLTAIIYFFGRREVERERQALSSQKAALEKEAGALQHQVAALLEQR